MTHRSTQEVMAKAIESKSAFVEFFKRLLGDFGDEVDQLRVMGYMCQAGVDLAQAELDELKLQEEVEAPKSRIILPN